jgi:hypothetical protein
VLVAVWNHWHGDASTRGESSCHAKEKRGLHMTSLPVIDGEVFLSADAVIDFFQAILSFSPSMHHRSTALHSL